MTPPEQDDDAKSWKTVFRMAEPATMAGLGRISHKAQDALAELIPWCRSDAEGSVRVTVEVYSDGDPATEKPVEGPAVNGPEVSGSLEVEDGA